MRVPSYYFDTVLPVPDAAHDVLGDVMGARGARENALRADFANIAIKLAAVS